MVLLPVIAALSGILVAAIALPKAAMDSLLVKKAENKSVASMLAGSCFKRVTAISEASTASLAANCPAANKRIVGEYLLPVSSVNFSCALLLLMAAKIGRAHVLTPVT